MSKPRLLDLFCGAGGAAMGYHRAGFEVVGIDVVKQPDYPFAFQLADALSYPLDGFDAIHASPPCQAFTLTAKGMPNHNDHHPDLLTPMRERLQEQTTTPWVIENVPNSPMRIDLVLCGTMFGLPLVRHRWFESSGWLDPWPPFTCWHHGRIYTVVGHPRGKSVIKWKQPPNITAAREAMGMPWAKSWRGLTQAIPPAYTEYIGRRWLGATRQEAVDGP